MCGPIFDETGKNGQSKMQQDAPADRQFQASRGYVQPPPMAKGIAGQQVMPARVRAGILLRRSATDPYSAELVPALS